MANVIIVGMQWGDEGKGKIVDLLCPAFDVVARYQGGHNAGHTVKFGDQHFSLSLIPSGILHEGVICVLGNGMVIDPAAFFDELDRLKALGVDAQSRLFVSNRAQVLLPMHALLDKARELASGDAKIGTTGAGIGPAYETKARATVCASRTLRADLEDRLRAQFAAIEPQLQSMGADALGHPAAWPINADWRERLKPFVRDTEQAINGAMREGKSVLFEGARARCSTSTTARIPTSRAPTRPPAALAPARASADQDRRRPGVVRRIRRVGGGPFTTELNDKTGEFLRERGHEFRHRHRPSAPLRLARPGGAALCLHAHWRTGLALTKLDVLDQLDEIKVCTAYRYRGTDVHHYPAEREVQEHAEPVYQTFKGWKSPTVGTLDEDTLPAAARTYIEWIEAQLEVPVVMISTGPRREETIVRETDLLNRLTSGRLATVLAQRGA